ncbi:MAG TPA: DUF3048 domain-containing protein [Candidatus Saccharimonadales bacterium]|nr:DUF3048 domain-containing protein [Candidatus Saccharimonadales bacterium]
MIDDIRPPRPPKPKEPNLPPPPPPVAPAAPSAPDPSLPEPEATIDLPAEGEPAKKRGLGRVRHHWYNFSRLEKISALVGLLIILAGIGLSSYLLFIRKSPQPITYTYIKKVKPAPKPVTTPSPLTGLPVDPALAKRPVTGVMIENTPPARPQSGLQDAGVVFEAIAEAGITRFLALFQDTQPQYVGPVRSLRPYYIDFATPFDASIAHVGGSPDALSQIRSGGKDLDQFFNAGAYWRISSRAAPHNVYTSFAKLDALNAAKGYTSSQVQSWPRKADAPLKTPTAKSINFNPSWDDYKVHYDYDKASNSYLRSEGGAPHKDLVSASDTTGVQLHPKVVIALVIGLSNGALDASGAYYSDYQDTGSGTAYVFQDGGVIEGSWSKADRASQFSFTDSTGKPIKLDAGQTWLTLVGRASQVSYSP